MMNDSLFERCKVNTNIDTDVFVGIHKEGDKYQITFPLGFHISDSEKELRKDILLLFSVLSRYTDRRESEIRTGFISEDNTDVPVPSYLYMIKDFFERGYYKERDNYYTTSKKGKINWNKTIKTQKPMIQDDEVFYLDYVIKKNALNENELITLVHKYCVYESFDKFGWLFTSFMPIKPKTSLTKRMMISVVNNKLQNTYNDRNKQLFKHMLAILKSQGDEASSEFRYGTYRFEYVWENMIDHTFGIEEKSDYFPKTSWHINGKGKHDNACLEPDSIMISGGKIYVLDAKYYKYGWSGNPGHLPESTSINKQITYGEYIAETEKFEQNNKKTEVYNAFIMPFDSMGEKFKTDDMALFIGTANSEWKKNDKKYENVLGILLDTKYLMSLDSRLDENEIMRLARLIEEKCPV